MQILCLRFIWKRGGYQEHQIHIVEQFQSLDNTRAIQLKYESTVTNEVAFADAQKVLDMEAEQALLNSWTPIDYKL